MIATDRCISLGMHLRACWTSFAETLMDKRSLYGYSERGSSWPFTYLCYDSASLDLIDGIAINLRISRGQRRRRRGRRRRRRRRGRRRTSERYVYISIYIYIYMHTYICVIGTKYTYIHTYVYLESKRIPMNTDQESHGTSFRIRRLLGGNSKRRGCN